MGHTHTLTHFSLLVAPLCPLSLFIFLSCVSESGFELGNQNLWTKKSKIDMSQLHVQLHIPLSIRDRLTAKKNCFENHTFASFMILIHTHIFISTKHIHAFLNATEVKVKENSN